jgi:hypothetical protein
MRVGDIVLFKNPGIYMKLISLYNYIVYKESKACHAGIVSKVKGNNVWIHEAIPELKSTDFKAHKYTIKQLRDKKVIVRRCPFKLKNVQKTIESYEQTYYDWISIFLMPFKLSVNSTNLMFCSEVCARVLYDCSEKDLDISAELRKPYEKITPMDLYLTKQLDTIQWN